MIFRLLCRWRDRHDPAAVMQTPVYKFSGYDQQKAHEGYLRSKAHTETGRPIQAPKKVRKPKAVVEPIRRRA